MLDFLKTLLSGKSCLAKNKGAYFSVVYGFMKDPIFANLSSNWHHVSWQLLSVPLCKVFP